MKVILSRTGKEVVESRTVNEYRIEQPVIIKVKGFDFHFKVIGKEIDILDRETGQFNVAFLVNVTDPRVYSDTHKYPPLLNKKIQTELTDNSFTDLIKENCSTDNCIFYFGRDAEEKIEAYLVEVINKAKKENRELLQAHKEFRLRTVDNPKIYGYRAVAVNKEPVVAKKNRKNSN